MTPDTQHVKVPGCGSLMLLRGVWYIRYHVNGVRRQESSHSANQKDAEKMLRLRVGQVDHDPRRDPTQQAKVRMATLFDLVVTDYANNRKRSDDTLAHRLKHLRPAFDAYFAVRVTGATVATYTATRLAEKAAPATINRELAVIRRAFTLAVEQGLLTSAPKISMLAENNVRKGFTDEMTFAEIERHLIKADAEDVADVARFAFESASRKGSVLPLTWEDVDRAEKLLTFSAEHEKNGEPRELPLIGPLAEMIEKRWELSALGCPYVFHRNGRPIKDFRESWAQACEAAGVPDLLFHDLRRSGVRRMDLNNIPRSVAMKISGHKTETVYKRYAIVTTDDVRRALQQVHAKATVIPLRKEA